LINNAGTATIGMCGDSNPWNFERTLSCIYVNTFPLPIITKIVLPKILEWKVKGKKGAVITVSSVAGWDTFYWGMSVYSATKGFNLRFS